MNKKHIITATSLFLALGIFFFAYQESWIVFMFPSTKSNSVVKKYEQSKPVILYAWINNTLKKEAISVIWSKEQDQNIKIVLNSWLGFLEDEQPAAQETQVDSVALSVSEKEAFISFNQYPFEKNQSTHSKLLWIEGLLQTIRENGIDIQSIRLLIHHQPLQDDHLNFNISWPITGYIQNK